MIMSGLLFNLKPFHLKPFDAVLCLEITLSTLIFVKYIFDILIGEKRRLV